MKDLIERLEKATCPDRELDKMIQCEIDGNDWDGLKTNGQQVWQYRYIVEGDNPKEALYSPEYTASLNAALTLVPESATGWMLSFDGNSAQGTIYRDGDGVIGQSPISGEPAIALCIAALKARKANGDG